METKPFSMQSPEQIAKFFGGDRNKILEALQSGALRTIIPPPYDSTLALAAVDWSDRTRAAMQAGQAPQQTVFQKMFSPTPPAPMAPAGLGATPEAAQMQAPAPVPEMPAPGMAMGGLTSLPVPDDMFDEPSNGSYAGGGLIAFGPGGSTSGISDLYDDVEYWESGGKQSAVSPKGARGVMQLMPDTMKDPGFGVTPPRDDSEAENRRAGREYLDAMYRRYGDKQVALAAYNWGPGNVDKWLKSGADPKKLPAETRKYIKNIMSNEGELAPSAQAKGNTLYGLPTDLQGNIDLLTSMAPEESEEQLAYREDLKNRLSEESRQQDRKDAFLGTGLAKLSEALGKSTSPTFLGGLAESLGTGASAISESLDAAEKETDAMQREYVALANASRKEKMDLMRMGVDVTGKMAGLAEGIEARNAEIAMKREEMEFEKDQRALDRAAQIEAQKIAAAGRTSDLESTAATIFLGLSESNKQGLLKKDGKPYKFAEEALRVKALHEAAKLLGKDKPPAAGLSPFGPLQPTGGSNSGVDLSQWGQPTEVSQ
jgi:hypothetical protein